MVEVFVNGRRIARRVMAALAACTLATLLAACGGSSGDPADPTPESFTIGGGVSGLTNNGLMLANGADHIALAAGATAFTLPTPVASGAAYAVTIQAQPAHLLCTLSQGSGTVANASVANVQVGCVPITHQLGGTIAGLVSTGLVLADGADTLSVADGATAFTFAQPVAEGATFDVVVATQPAGQTCGIGQGSGTVDTVDVTTPHVVCSDLSYTVGGTIAGLSASGLVLSNNGDTVSPAAGDTSFTFAGKVPFESAYDVVVSQQPTGLTCTVAGPFAATIGAGNITGISVSCQTASGIVPFVGEDDCPFQVTYADGLGSAADVPGAISMSSDAAGNLYVSEGTVLRKITPAGLVSTIAGRPGTPGILDGTGSAAHFEFANGLTADANGNLFVADSAAIRTVSTAGVVMTLAGGSGFGGFADGTGINAQFAVAIGVARDGAGNLYVADVENNAIRKVTPAGVTTVFSGTRTAGFVDGPASTAQFDNPTDIVIDSAGRLYVADTLNNAIRVVATDGSVTTLAGSSSGAVGFADGQGSSARFYGPSRLAISSTNVLYVLDQKFSGGSIGGEAVRIVDTSGNVTTLGAMESYDFVNGPAFHVPASSRVEFPFGSNVTGVGAGPNGIVYVAYGCAIHKVNP